MTSYQESESAHRPDRHDPALGCLVPLIAATISLAIVVTLVSWLWVDAPDEDSGEPASRAVSQADDPEAFSDSDPYAAEGAPTAAILEVVKSGGWRQVGPPDKGEAGAGRHAVYHFRRGDQRLQVTIYSFDGEDAARAQLDRFTPTAPAVRFDDKVVVIEPTTEAAGDEAEVVAERLRRFRNLLQGGLP